MKWKSHEIGYPQVRVYVFITILIHNGLLPVGPEDWSYATKDTSLDLVVVYFFISDLYCYIWFRMLAKNNGF